MPRKPNYKFARQERERAKVKKKAERFKAKADQKAQKAKSANPDLSEPEANAGFSPENPPDMLPVDDETV